ncbi:hypothetical protein FMN50_24660 [Rhodobacterales bacterium]|nr:hypothetical protein FMN50_24660 [Rhodobacterales bacterium]
MLGYAFLAIAIIAGISDASISIAQSQVYMAPLVDVWFELSPRTLELMNESLRGSAYGHLWEPGLRVVLAWPVWAVFAPLGLIFLWLGSRRRTAHVQYA